MRKFFVLICSILLMPCYISGQGIEIDNSEKSVYFLIDDAFYIHGDSSLFLDNWLEQELHILFSPTASDSLIISIDIGGRDKVYFMGMAVAIDNPGFIASNAQAEFYHWIFVSHIKEGINNAYIHKEYVDESLEKLGYKLYFINILFPDQTEFQFYGSELTDG